MNTNDTSPVASAPTTTPLAATRQMDGRTPAQRTALFLWRTVGQRLFSLTFHNWYRLRVRILRAFGARVADTARIRPSVQISHPWNLTIAAHATLGDHAILYSLGPISIGRRSTISQHAHLCAASRDHTRRDMPLIALPIVIQDDAWVATDVFVGPGVTIGTDTVVGARSTVMHDLPPRSVCAGDNARVLGPRIIRFPAGTPTP